MQLCFAPFTVLLRDLDRRVDEYMLFFTMHKNLFVRLGVQPKVVKNHNLCFCDFSDNIHELKFRVDGSNSATADEDSSEESSEEDLKIVFPDNLPKVIKSCYVSKGCCST